MNDRPRPAVPTRVFLSYARRGMRASDMIL